MMRRDPAHMAVDGGFECECGETRRTPLGMRRHRDECNGQDSDSQGTGGSE